MTTIRSAKQKGSCFEMDICYSLNKIYPNLRRLGGEGQYREIDLIDDSLEIAIECKKHKKFSWNELVGYLDKLVVRSPYEDVYVIYQENYKPAKVMRYENNIVSVSLFEDYFGVSLQKHKYEKNK